MQCIFENIDCFEKMKKMQDNSVRLIITDPPYGISFNGITSKTSWDNMDNKQFCLFIKKFLIEAKRILTEDGTLWMCCSRTKIPDIFRIIDQVGLKNNLENWMTYVRNKGRCSSKKLKSVCEEVLHITKSDNYSWNKLQYLREVVAPYVKDGKPRGWTIDQNTGLRVRWSGVGNALYFSNPFFQNKFQKQIHSTQKPFLLWTMLIKISSKKGDYVFDPFAGSASSGVACIVNERNYIGCELDKQMFEKASDWLNNIDYELAKEYVCSRLKDSQKQLTLDL